MGLANRSNIGTKRRREIAVECPGAAPAAMPVNDYFVRKDGLEFAGTHLLIDMWGAGNLTDEKHIEAALIEAAEAAGATVLAAHLQRFDENGGISGVLVLAESHMSIHTWPERKFAAVDIFMCGRCDPELAIPVLKRAFSPATIKVNEQRRGLMP
jgi:S-adenosylmethionine decarboxylase